MMSSKNEDLFVAKPATSMTIHPISIRPRFPEVLQPLRELAYNIWFSWNWEVVDLFIRLNATLWEQSYQNPVLMLEKLSQADLDRAIADKEFMKRLKEVHHTFQDYLKSPSWFLESQKTISKTALLTNEKKGGSELKKIFPCEIAYFSMEYGIDEALPIYSGGLGVLAGDHLKSSSDLGLPLVGVGLLYEKGYLQQVLDSSGWQQEAYPKNDWNKMPVVQERDKKTGLPLTLSVSLAGEPVEVQVWRVSVGRIPLYLLDTDLPSNPPQHRIITNQLYGGDREMRMCQEIVLGIGGMRALEALGHHPTVFHMNEGHSAFSSLERIRIYRRQYGLSFAEARELVWASTIFTTHTPVPAGNEVFDVSLVQKYFSAYAGELDLSWSEFIALGQESTAQNSSSFSLTVLAFRLAAFLNGVSRLHGQVSRRMWSAAWPSLPESDIPITSITNGIHTHSWVSHDFDGLYRQYLGPRYRQDPAHPDTWSSIQNIPNNLLWQVHEHRRERLITFARKRLKRQLLRDESNPSRVAWVDHILNPKALTLGFARRFTGYKRADLLLRNPDRLARLLTDPARPVQMVFAGKAHPQDHPGKELIKRILEFSRRDFVRNQVVFLEDYDINLARYLVQGVDVWLNTPRRGLEASGTSGMKAAANGIPHLSVLDGWWDEAYRPEAGWAITPHSTSSDPNDQDTSEAQYLYDILEKEVLPLFYERDAQGLPQRWIGLMKSTIQTMAPYFSSHRMVQEYTRLFYEPAAQAAHRLEEKGAAPAKALAAWQSKIAEGWDAVGIHLEEKTLPREIQAGEKIPLTVYVHLPDRLIAPQDVRVQVYYGPLSAQGEILDGKTMDLPRSGLPHTENKNTPPRGATNEPTTAYTYHAELPCAFSGTYGVTARLLPHHPHLIHPFTPLFIAWA